MGWEGKNYLGWVAEGEEGIVVELVVVDMKGTVMVLVTKMDTEVVTVVAAGMEITVIVVLAVVVVVTV